MKVPASAYWQGHLALQPSVSLKISVTTDAPFDPAHHVSEENRVIRRIALRGSAMQGIAFARADLVPEVWEGIPTNQAREALPRGISPLADSCSGSLRSLRFACDSKSFSQGVSKSTGRGAFASGRFRSGSGRRRRRGRTELFVQPVGSWGRPISTFHPRQQPSDVAYPPR
jgi:hypothetical protein